MGLLVLEIGDEGFQIYDRACDFGVDRVGVLVADLIACDCDITRVQISDAVDVKCWLVGYEWLVEELVFVLGDDVDDRCSTNVGLIRFGIDSDKDDFIL